MRLIDEVIVGKMSEGRKIRLVGVEVDFWMYVYMSFCVILLLYGMRIMFLFYYM